MQGRVRPRQRPNVRPNERKEVAADLTPELVSELVAELWPALCLLPSNCYGLFQFLGHLRITTADPQSNC